MHLHVFGSPVLLRDGQPVSGAGTQRRRLALLATLAIAAPPGRGGVPRERLLALLWPDADEERGRAALSQALYAIRRELGADDAITGSTELRLNADLLACDYWDFLRAADEGDDARAAALRTAPLLDGFDLAEARGFDLWIEAQRNDADQRWREAAERAVRRATQRGELAEVVRWRRALANADPLSGTAAIALARALAEAGEPEAALRQLRVHTELVRQELETEPQAEVARLAEAIQRGAVAAKMVPGAEPVTAVTGAAPPGTAGTMAASPATADASTAPLAARASAPVAADSSAAPDTRTATPSTEPTPRRPWRLALAAAVALGLIALASRLPSRAAPGRAPAPGDTMPVSTSAEALRLYWAATDAMAAGRRDAAVAQLRGALAADPGMAEAALRLAMVLGGDDPEFMPLLKRAYDTSDRTTLRNRLLIHEEWYRATADPQLVPVMDSLLAAYPADLEIRMHAAGPALYQQADFARARRLLEQVWAADSANIRPTTAGRCYACEAVVHLTTVHFNADSLEAARRMVERYLALAPDDPLAWERLAQVLERTPAQHAAMRAAVDSAVRRGRPSARALELVAATRRGDSVAFERALAALAPPPGDRDRSVAWARTLLYRNLGHLESALAEARRYRRAVEQEAGKPARQAPLLEAAVLQAMGRGREAAALFEQIARAPRPTEAPSYQARQLVWFRTLAATARFEAGDTAGLATLADTLAVLGQRSGAARDRALHHHVRGLAYLARGAREEAVVELERGIVYPSAGYTRTNWWLARTLDALGRRAEARRWLEAALHSGRDEGALYLAPGDVRAALAAR